MFLSLQVSTTLIGWGREGRYLLHYSYNYIFHVTGQ